MKLGDYWMCCQYFNSTIRKNLSTMIQSVRVEKRFFGRMFHGKLSYRNLLIYSTLTLAVNLQLFSHMWTLSVVRRDAAGGEHWSTAGRTGGPPQKMRDPSRGCPSERNPQSIGPPKKSGTPLIGGASWRLGTTPMGVPTRHPRWVSYFDNIRFNSISAVV